MKLSKKERWVLTYLKHGAEKRNLVRHLQSFLGLKYKEVVQILAKLKRRRLIEESIIKKPDLHFVITSDKVNKTMCDKTVDYIMMWSSKYKTFKEYLESRKKSKA